MRPAAALHGRRYWRSLEDLADTPQFRELLEREFPPSVSELFQASRRRFLKFMGASLGLAGLAGCVRYPEERLAPYAHRPENRTPGVPVSYATAMELGGVAQGLLVTSYDGRPIKVEGNPSHPLNRGAADAIAQASVLEVYDPDRSRGVIRRDGDERTQVSWDEFFEWAKLRFQGDGAGVCILSEATGSPTVADLRARLKKALPKSKWFEYESLSDDNSRAALRRMAGKPLRCVPDLSQADVIVSLDADLFGDGTPLAIKHARDFAAGRRLADASFNRDPTGSAGGAIERSTSAPALPHPQAGTRSRLNEGTTAARKMNRLYVVESLHTITGACADHRRAVRPGAVGAVAAQLLSGLQAPNASRGGEDSGVDQKFIEAVVADLKAARGRAVVVAGPRQPPEVHMLVAAINAKLGNTGKAIVSYADAEPDRPGHVEALKSLVKKIDAGEVKTLLILGGNPAFNAPADIPFAAALEKVRDDAVHLALHEDETSLHCRWHLSRTHFLEAWGDARTYDGTVSLVQPLIEPLFDGKSVPEVLARLLGDETKSDNGGYELVRRTFRSLLGDGFSEWKWKQALADGVIAGTTWKPLASEEVELSGDVESQRGSGQSPNLREEYELVFFADSKVFDGRFANSGWLQELPDPMTRLTWDNAALISPQTAESLGIKGDELVSIRTDGDRQLTVPAFLLPGMPDGVVGLAVGYGRTAVGHVGQDVGHNAFALRTSDNLGWVSGVTVQPTGKTHPLATVQDHHIIDPVGRKAVQERIPVLIREGSAAEFRDDPALGVDKTRQLSMFNEHRLDGGVAGQADQSNVPAHERHRWGLAVDLSACTGCGACVVACQAENNVPVVGKEQVLHGRIMHWIRVDRYFRETPDEPVAVHQPVMCMHCENAPCESVCPVAATSHSQEGLNMMTYNRCVGTRYCANNCPYKVRRFNYFDFNRGNLGDEYTPNLAREPVSELVKMQKNPDVTVRMRGVMEKCTFCIQRIENARIAAKREAGRPLKDGEIQTACQQTCPAQAIVFGDLNDPNSRVAQLQNLPRSYGMLDETLNTKPRTEYVAKIRNPAPGLDEA